MVGLQIKNINRDFGFAAVRPVGTSKMGTGAALAGDYRKVTGCGASCTSSLFGSQLRGGANTKAPL